MWQCSQWAHNWEKTQEMYQVVMQLVSSHLKENLGDDNESGASEFVIIFCIFLSVANDGKPP
jgi:F0F1-type ATP synthase membrane subunit a